MDASNSKFMLSEGKIILKGSRDLLEFKGILCIKQSLSLNDFNFRGCTIKNAEKWELIQVCSKRETKVMAFESSKTTYFCHETGCHSKISSIKRVNKLTLAGDYAIKVMIFSHSNDYNFGKSKRFLVSLNWFFEFLMNVVHMIWNGIGRENFIQL